MPHRSVSYGRVRPQAGVERGGEAGDGGHVGPRVAGQQVGDRLPVHPGPQRGLAQAPPPPGQGSGQGGGDLPHRLHPGLGVGPVGPGFRILGTLPGGAHAGSTTDHLHTILSVELGQSPDGCLSSRYSWSVVLDPLTSAKILRYRPRDGDPAWDTVAPTVRAVVAATVTQVPYDVERLLHVTGRLALWVNDAGLAPEPDAWLRGEVIDAFVLSLAGQHAPATLRTYRTWLRRVRDALAWSDRGEPVPPKLSAPAKPHQPYDAAELAGLWHWAEHLPTRQRADAPGTPVSTSG